MQDRPNREELLAAVERFLRDDVMSGASGAQPFHARVAANVLAIVRRELEHEEAHLAREWAGLDALLGASPRPDTVAALREAIAARNDALCARIRAGEADTFRAALLDHLRAAVRDKLVVTNPRWIDG